jgi:nicotinate-nucleotide pyrophosphorylase (carboxylating)
VEEVRGLVELAMREDLGGVGGGGVISGDVTSSLLVGEDRVGVGTLLQKEVGVVCGLPLIEMVCRAYDERLRVEQIPGFHFEVIEGRFSDQRVTPLVRLRGPMRSLLAAERVILNFLQHLSGVATLTQRYVRRIEGTRARIFDTRKTMPGYRALDKYAVRAGGGVNHRMGLYDGVLIKDNHLAGLSTREIAPFLEKVVRQHRSNGNGGGGKSAGGLFEVEVDTLEQFSEVMKVEGVNVIMLDNMDCPRMEEAVRLRDAAGKRGVVDLEASGGVTLDTVRTIALTGVERISVGAITHSAPALDISLDIEE